MTCLMTTALASSSRLKIPLQACVPKPVTMSKSDMIYAISRLQRCECKPEVDKKRFEAESRLRVCIPFLLFSVIFGQT